MSVNPVVGENEVQGIFAELWPVNPEPGSVADQLLTKGRQESLIASEFEDEYGSGCEPTLKNGFELVSNASRGPSLSRTQISPLSENNLQLLQKESVVTKRG
ncbi:hypothetical protein SH501x_004728 [Pirellulaceae bacterium SH501]